jgi:sirohydrochlorin ferrochelatase
MEQDGILIAMHPSSADEENPRYLRTVLAHDYPVPARATLIDKRSALQEPIDELVAEGVDRIVVVPLYPSVLNIEVRAFFARLGIGQFPMEYYADSALARSPVPVVIGQPFGGQPLLAEMHLDLARAQSSAPAEEALLVLYHGNLPGFATAPEDGELFDGFVAQLHQQAPFAAVETAHVYPRSTITATAKRLADQHARVVTVPYFLGSSRFTTRILPRYLAKAERDGIAYDGQTILEHPRLGEYVTDRYREVVEQGVDRSADIAAVPPEPRRPVIEAVAAD